MDRPVSQDLSIAGNQKGIHAGERSSLFFEAIRIIKEMRDATSNQYPRFAVWENVKGAFSSNKGEDFRAVLQAFADIGGGGIIPEPPKGKWKPIGNIVGDGWSLAWRMYDAQYTGVPQRRERIYLVADFGSERAGEILLECEGELGDFAPRREAWERITANAPGGAGGSDSPCGPNPAGYQGGNVIVEQPVYALEGNGCRPSHQGIGANDSGKMYTLNTIERHAVAFQQNQREEVRVVGDKAGAVTAQAGMHNNNFVCLFMGGQGAKARSIAYCDDGTTQTMRSAPSGSNTVPDVCYEVKEAGCKVFNESGKGYWIEGCGCLRSEVVCYDCRGNGEGGVVPTLTGDHQNRVTDYTAIICYASGAYQEG